MKETLIWLSLMMASGTPLSVGFGAFPPEIKWTSSNYFADTLCSVDTVAVVDSTIPDSQMVYFCRILGDTGTVYLKALVGHLHGDTARVPVPYDSLKGLEPLIYIILPYGYGKALICNGVSWVIIPRPFRPTIPVYPPKIINKLDAIDKR